MEKLRAKLRKNSGFTLIEMLIVVAIIAILIAVSIPLVNGALEQARDATDQANERAAKAETILYFTGVVTDDALTAAGNYKPGTAIPATGGTALYYDAEDGSIKTTKPEAYGQCSGGANDKYSPNDAHTGKVIQVTITADGVFEPVWVTATP